MTSEEVRKYYRLIDKYDVDEMFKPYMDETISSIVSKLKKVFLDEEVYITDSFYLIQRPISKRDLDEIYTNPELDPYEFFFEPLYYENTRMVLDGNSIWDYVFAVLCEHYPEFNEQMEDEEASELMYCAIADNEYEVCFEIEAGIRDALPEDEVLQLLEANPHCCC